MVMDVDGDEISHFMSRISHMHTRVCTYKVQHNMCTSYYLGLGNGNTAYVLGSYVILPLTLTLL
jgi:hypothetical protein